jgi:5-formyltetrahydrofolate cyclo-ligase
VADIQVKKNLRKKLLGFRQMLTPAQLETKSREIFNHWLKNFPPENFKWIHLFLPIDSKNEVNTRLIRNEIDRYFPSVKSAVPVTDFSGKIIRSVFVSPDIKLVTNKFGIPEPEMESEVIPGNKFDLVLVPLLGFDNQGYRIGYGMGLYDRFLNETREDCVKAGIGFDLSFVPEGIPAEQHDVRLDCVITESGIKWFNEKKEK